MTRSKGPDEAKLNKIRAALEASPEGLWVREIARRAGLDKSTVSIYLSRHMQGEIEEAFPAGSQWIRIVRLRS